MQLLAVVLHSLSAGQSFKRLNIIQCYYIQMAPVIDFAIHVSKWPSATSQSMRVQDSTGHPSDAQHQSIATCVYSID